MKKLQYTKFHIKYLKAVCEVKKAEYKKAVKKYTHALKTAKKI